MDTCDLKHARMISHLMPERDLRAGDRVWDKLHQQHGFITHVSIIDYAIYIPDNGKEVTGVDKGSLTRLYTFSEIWAELRKFLKDGLSYVRMGIDQGITFMEIAFQDGSTVHDPTPANCAAELLKWVKERT